MFGIFRTAISALEKKVASEFEPKLAALDLNVEDAAATRKAMYLQLDAKIQLEAQKMRVDMLANETAAAEKVETLARKMQELTKEEQATRDAAAEEMPAWLLEAEEIVATTRRV